MQPANKLSLTAFRERLHDRLSEEPVVRCTHAKTVCRHRPAGQEAMTPSADSLARIGGVMSSKQVQSLGLQNHPGLDCARPVASWRPPRYGRACIVRAHDLDPDFRVEGSPEGLFDIKGSGIDERREPSFEHDHQNGVVLLDEAICEFIHYLIIDALVDARSAPFHCLPHYGVVDLGLRFAMAGGPELPACTIVRAAHLRPPRNNEVPVSDSYQHHLKELTEAWLNHHFLSSAHIGYRLAETEEGIKISYLGKELSWPANKIRQFVEMSGFPVPFTHLLTNIQFCDTEQWRQESCAIVDFMHYTLAEERTECSAMTLVANRPGHLGRALPAVELAFPPGLVERLSRKTRPADILRPDQLAWLEQFETTKHAKNGVRIFALGLCHDYLHGLCDSQGLFETVRRFADDCVGLILDHAAPV